MINVDIYKKQLEHQYAQEAIDEKNNITIFAIGGFMPEDIEEAKKWLLTNQTLKNMTGMQLNISEIIKIENEFRISLINKLNYFLKCLEQSKGVLKNALMLCGMSRGQVEKYRGDFPIFRTVWDEIVQGIIDELEEAAFQRAVRGVEKDVYFKGQVVGKETQYSDSLLALMLTNRRSELYGKDKDTKKENGQVLSVTINKDDEKL